MWVIWSAEHINKFIWWGRVCVEIRFHMNFPFVSSILDDEIEAKKMNERKKLMSIPATSFLTPTLISTINCWSKTSTLQNSKIELPEKWRERKKKSVKKHRKEWNRFKNGASQWMSVEESFFFFLFCDICHLACGACFYFITKIKCDREARCQ